MYTRIGRNAARQKKTSKAAFFITRRSQQ